VTLNVSDDGKDSRNSLGGLSSGESWKLSLSSSCLDPPETRGEPRSVPDHLAGRLRWVE
jgi:hypothetical protein